jgi:hypothetical protein
MTGTIQGAFHFHSTYSHDGRSTLPEIAAKLSASGLAFCIMTEHFEDFNAAQFDRYVRDLQQITESTGFLFIPGVEVHLSGIDTLIFPAREFEPLVRLAETGKDTQPPLFKVLAHPTKYSLDEVDRHLKNYAIQGIELWNQQADGSHIPPVQFLQWMKDHAQRNQHQYFFGCDLHDANLTVANVLSLPAAVERTPEGIARRIMAGGFVSRNLPTGVEYGNGPGRIELGPWLKSVLTKSYYRGKLLRGVRRGLRSIYKKLPRNAQHSLNDVKNFVRNKV